MVKKVVDATPNHLLIAARKERGWTQKDVADRIGAPLSLNISRWENGTTFPRPHYIEQLCQLFGRSARDLGLTQGEIAPQSEYTPPPAPLDPSSISLWTVPYRRNPFFTGREEVLELLHERLTVNKAIALTQTQAISGLGGIGKTQIAVEYAYRYHAEYRSVLWLRAASRDVLFSDFVTLASLLRLPEQDEQDLHRVVAAVKGWLANAWQGLLILDNADDLDLVATFLPTGDNSSILLTTRAQATGWIAPSIAVEKLNQNESMLLLLRRAQLLAPDASLEQTSRQDRVQAEAIVMAMDGLPLALDQAGAYIEETSCSLADYTELYRTHRRKLLQRRSQVPSDHPEPVAATWVLSFRKVEQANPAAADLLRLCAFLNPDAIPEAIIIEGAVELGPALGPVAGDRFQLNEVIEVLSKYSLLRRDPDAKMFTIHRLVQAILKDEMDEQTQRQWAERAVRAVNVAFPEVTFLNWQRCQQYLPHAQACARLIEQYELTFPEAARLLARAGCHAQERALYVQAEPLLQRALAIRERVLGPEHPDTAASFNDLARLYHMQGKFVQAEPLLQRALAIRERVLGPEHPDTATSLTDLARLYHMQGKFVQAEPLLQRALAIRERVLGPEHPDTATSLTNLTALYYVQGKYAEVEPLLQRVLAICEHMLGPEHPSTSASLNTLAALYYIQGKYAEAEPLLKRAQAILERVLGPEHPSTATILNNLAMLYYIQGEFVQAEPLLQRALAIRERVQGPEHPSTSSTLDNLSMLYYIQGEFVQAEPLLQRALAIREHKMGPYHLFTAFSLNNLALLYDTQGKYAEAEPLLQRTLAIIERVMGPENYLVALSLNNLAMFYHVQGRYAEAEPLYLRTLEISEKAFVPEPLDVATYLENYADLLRKMKHEAEGTKREGLD